MASSVSDVEGPIILYNTCNTMRLFKLKCIQLVNHKIILISATPIKWSWCTDFLISGMRGYETWLRNVKQPKKA